MEKMDFFKKTSTLNYSSQSTNKINQNKSNEINKQSTQLNQVKSANKKDDYLPLDNNKTKNQNNFLDNQEKNSFVNEINYNSLVSDSLTEINMKLNELKTFTQNIEISTKFDPNEVNKVTSQILQATNKIAEETTFKGNKVVEKFNTDALGLSNITLNLNVGDLNVETLNVGTNNILTKVESEDPTILNNITLEKIDNAINMVENEKNIINVKANKINQIFNQQIPSIKEDEVKNLMQNIEGTIEKKPFSTLVVQSNFSQSAISTILNIE